MPLRKSKVNYTVALNGYYSDQQKTTEGTTETDDEGNFSIAVKLLPPPHKNADEEDDDDIVYLEDEDCVVDSAASVDEDVFMSDEYGLDDDADEVQEAPINSLAMSTLTVSVSASIVAPDGETRSDQTYIVAGTKRYRTEASWPSIICKERLPEIRVHRLGYGNKISLASGRYVVRLDDGSKIGGKIVAQDTFIHGEGIQTCCARRLENPENISWRRLSRVRIRFTNTCFCSPPTIKSRPQMRCCGPTTPLPATNLALIFT